MRDSRELSSRHRRTRQALLQAALTCAERWRWPVVPGAVLVERVDGLGTWVPPASCRTATRRRVSGGARAPDGLLLRRPALRGARRTPARPVPAGGHHRCPDGALVVGAAQSAGAGDRGDRRGGGGGQRAGGGGRAAAGVSGRAAPAGGPGAGGPTRWALLVAPYSYPELAELLVDQERTLCPGGAPGEVPSSVRYHGPGGFLVLPPSRVGDAGTPGRRLGRARGCAGCGGRWRRRAAGCGCRRWRACWRHCWQPDRRRRTGVDWPTDGPSDQVLEAVGSVTTVEMEDPAAGDGDAPAAGLFKTVTRNRAAANFPARPDPEIQGLRRINVIGVTFP